ncbi:MAG: ABC transporter ATP-binding protein [Acidimicrobiia bacterium]|nr:ABC transporter ATP-binding protein [Acidimicrobiia bacterium]
MAVSLAGVWKTYGEGPTAIHALKDITLHIPDGEFIVILGPSGSGKTTLLNLVGTIDQPTAGEIEVNGVDLTALDMKGRTRFRRNAAGFVFQFFNLIPTLTALENVELVAELSADGASGRSRLVLEQVGLGDRLDNFPGQLSGGEQQRVAIARALVKGPPLLLCDEPTGELDFETGRVILDLLHRLNREEGHTVLLVTHNAAIGEMADRVLRLHSGSLVEDHEVREPVAATELSW